MQAKPPLKIVLCSPRGFCAGVVRAIDTVERALTLYGAPVYVGTRSSITNTWSTASGPRARFSSRNWPKFPTIPTRRWCFRPTACRNRCRRSRRRNFFSLDATCPLVTKVHREAAIHFKRGREILLIGHSHHPEVVGTLGQLPAGAVTLIETAEEARTFRRRTPTSSLSSPRPRCRSTTPPRSSRCCTSASPTSPGRTRKTSATPPPTARWRSRRWRRWSTR